MFAMETLEDKAARLALKRKKYREFREKQKATETPEQTALRRAKRNEKERKRCQIKLATTRAVETPEQKAARLFIQNETYKKKRKKKISLETPEQTTARRAKAVEREQQRIRLLRANETPEQAAARRANQAKNRRWKRQIKRATEMAVVKANQLQTANKQFIEYYEQIEDIAQKSRTQTLQEKAGQFSETTTQEDINGYCTLSSFGPSESSFRRTTSESSFTTTTSEDPFQLNPSEATVVKKEPSQSQYSWALFDASHSTSVTQELFSESRYFESVKREPQDTNYQPLPGNDEHENEHSLYAKYIAERLTACNRSNAEIDCAKQQIENIMFNLSTGSYRSFSFSDRNTIHQIQNITFLPTPVDVVQSIIVKEEIDL